MARVRPASDYAHPRSQIRQIARAGRVQVRPSLKTALEMLPKMLDRDLMIKLIRSGRHRDIAHTAIDWHHFKQVLRHPYERLARVYEAGAKLGEQKINRAFAQRGRGVRYSKGETGSEGDRHNHHAGGNHIKESRTSGADPDLAAALQVLNSPPGRIVDGDGT